MGVLFNDPDVDYDDIYWYFMLACQMHESIGQSFKAILRLCLLICSHSVDSFRLTL